MLKLYHSQQNKWDPPPPPKVFTCPFWSYTFILVVANLLAHNNILLLSQICYCSQISLQSAAVNIFFLQSLTFVAPFILLAMVRLFIIIHFLRIYFYDILRILCSQKLFRFMSLKTKFMLRSLLFSSKKKRFHSSMGRVFLFSFAANKKKLSSLELFEKLQSWRHSKCTSSHLDSALELFEL